jgi:hypothetical protein
MLIVPFFNFYAECRYGECRYGECRNAKCHVALYVNENEFLFFHGVGI